MSNPIRKFPVLLASALMLAPLVEARIVRIEITRTESPTFGGMEFGQAGRYESLAGRAFGEIDPEDARNKVIADIAMAPRNARGMVEYSTDILILTLPRQWHLSQDIRGKFVE